MLDKVFIIVFLLATMVVQDHNAETMYELENERISLGVNSATEAHSKEIAPVMKSTIGELMERIKGLIKRFKTLVDDIIPDTLVTCRHFMETITNLKDTCIGEGTHNISNGIDNIFTYIQVCTAEAAQAGVDITVCIAGKKDQLTGLSTHLASSLTECVSGFTDGSVKRVNNIISVCDGIVQDLLNMPIAMSQCLASLPWHPMTCLKDLSVQIANQIIKFPIYVIDIVNEAKISVAALPDNLLGCSVRASKETAIETGVVHDQIKECVDEQMKDAPNASTPSSASLAALTRSGRAPMDVLYEQIKDSITSLNHVISSVVKEAIGTECISTIIRAYEESQQQHVDDIVRLVASSIAWIQDITAEAAALGVNVDICVTGKQAQFNMLEYVWIDETTRRIHDTVNQGIEHVETALIPVRDIIAGVLHMPTELGKCATDAKQWRCLTDLLQGCHDMNAHMPARIRAVLDAALTIAHSTHATIRTDVGSIKASINRQAVDIKTEISSCCDDILHRDSY